MEVRLLLHLRDALREAERHVVHLRDDRLVNQPKAWLLERRARGLRSEVGLAPQVLEGWCWVRARRRPYTSPSEVFSLLQPGDIVTLMAATAWGRQVANLFAVLQNI